MRNRWWFWFSIFLVLFIGIDIADRVMGFPGLFYSPKNHACTSSDTLRIHFTNTPLGVTFTGCIRDSAIVWGELFKSWQVDSTAQHIVKCSIEKHRLSPGDTLVLVVE